MPISKDTISLKLEIQQASENQKNISDLNKQINQLAKENKNLAASNRETEKEMKELEKQMAKFEKAGKSYSDTYHQLENQYNASKQSIVVNCLQNLLSLRSETTKERFFYSSELL